MLPRNDLPNYQISLPSNGQSLTIRPYTVKEEKILMLASQNDDENERESSVKQVIKNCIISPESFDVSDLKLYDVDYLFLQLRARSSGETVTLTFEPIKGSECVNCSKERKVLIDLLTIGVKTPDNHIKKFQLNEKLGIVMKDPTFKLVKDISKAKESQNFDDILKIYAKCIDYLYDADENIYTAKDSKLEDLVSFIEGLKSTEFQKIDQFFETLPHLEHIVDLGCSECNRDQSLVLKELRDFLE